jgi:hypothetical protein
MTLHVERRAGTARALLSGGRGVRAVADVVGGGEGLSSAELVVIGLAGGEEPLDSFNRLDLMIATALAALVAVWLLVYAVLVILYGGHAG